MNNNYTQIMLRLWESACRDEPQRPSCTVQDGRFYFRIAGNQDQWVAMCAAAGVPADARQAVEGNTLICSWPSLADEIFGADGLIARYLGASYEVRLPQLHMARLVQRAIEMRQPVVVEAGTGVGKSFAYAAICMAMGKKVIISTSNKALQMQLYRKDIPFLQQLFPGKKLALAVGKSNYACRQKVEDGFSGAVAIENEDLRHWYLGTQTGNVEEIPFQVDWKALAALTVDDDCAGKHCPFYATCFYFDAKEQRRNADVLVTNHALLCLHTLYESAAILPPCDVLVVDEAHKLPDYVRNTLGFEQTLTGVDKTLDGAEPFIDDQDLLAVARRNWHLFKADLSNWSSHQIDGNNKLPPQLDLAQMEFQSGVVFAESAGTLAAEVWPEDAMPTDAEDKRRAKRATKLRNLADRMRTISQLPDPNADIVRWVQPVDEKLCAAPANVADFVGSMAGFFSEPTATTPDYTRCTRCNRSLTADTVAILEGLPFGPDCIRKVDLFGDAEHMSLAQWLSSQRTVEPSAATTERATIFTSATLATPDLTHFMAECGIPDALRMQADSPFDYRANALLYVPNGNSPAPNESLWANWAVEQMAGLVMAAQGGAFLLFTSNAMLRYAVERLRTKFVVHGLQVFVQGEWPKLEIAQRFRANGNAVLFATKSFFEGVSIDGDALRLVVVDKLPFDAPSPLGAAMEAAASDRLRVLNAPDYAIQAAGFSMVRLPRMTIELKQACGRLIRTQSDRGVLAVLDSRLRTSQYGRKSVLPALPPARLVSDLEDVSSFYK